MIKNRNIDRNETVTDELAENKKPHVKTAEFGNETRALLRVHCHQESLLLRHQNRTSGYRFVVRIARWKMLKFDSKNLLNRGKMCPKLIGKVQ